MMKKFLEFFIFFIYKIVFKFVTKIAKLSVSSLGLEGVVYLLLVQ